MKSVLVGVAVLASGCSAAAASDKTQYERAIECELLTGTLAALHPSLTQERIVELQQGQIRYNRASERLGSEMNKSAFEIDLDRRKFMLALEQELMASNADSVTNAKLDIANNCLSEG